MTTEAETKVQDADPEPIMRLSMSYAPERCLLTACQLGLFSHIADGNHTADEVAKAAEASPRGIRMLLDSLTACELLEKNDGRYQLTAASRQYLVRDSPDYMGGMMEMDALWQSWSRLTDVVRTGKPLVSVEEEEAGGKFFAELVRSLHIWNRGPSRRAARALGAGTTHKAMQVLDVACGSGVWGIAVAEADEESRVTFQDFQKILDIASEYAERHGVADRSEYLPGNLKKVDFGEARYDLALLGNIVHSEGERSSRDLFKRLHRALKPGGRLVVIDMIPNEDRTGPLFAVTFALNMFLHTEEGDTYTLGEYTEWLSEAGFGKVETTEIEFHSPLIVATRD